MCLSQVFVFQHMYWVTLAVVYITVQSTISIFNFGFILWCFFFLWHGQALYLQPRTRLFKLWKIFIGYNYFTLLAKVCLQVTFEMAAGSERFNLFCSGIVAIVNSHGLFLLLENLVLILYCNVIFVVFDETCYCLNCMVKRKSVQGTHLLLLKVLGFHPRQTLSKQEKSRSKLRNFSKDTILCHLHSFVEEVTRRPNLRIRVSLTSTSYNFYKQVR